MTEKLDLNSKHIWSAGLRKPRKRKHYSQWGQDGIIDRIFSVIGTTNNYFVEFGAVDGRKHSNTFYLRNQGWKGLLLDDGRDVSDINLHKEWITMENINELFDKYDVPYVFDFLSIDIDGNDYWVWKGLTKYEPRVVQIECNTNFPLTDSKVIPYQPQRLFMNNVYYGASVKALYKLGVSKGYTFIYFLGSDMFFVKPELLSEYDKNRTMEDILSGITFPIRMSTGDGQVTIDDFEWVDV
jgi:hypothetical protein